MSEVIVAKGEQARALFEQGYNCAQATFLTFCQEAGMPFEQALRLTSSFGGGMGRLREVCGAVTGMFMAAGLIYGPDDPTDDAAKKAHYARIQQLAADFKARNGTIICRELLGLQEQVSDPTPSPRTPAYYQKRRCGAFIQGAAEQFAAYLQAHPAPDRGGQGGR